MSGRDVGEAKTGDEEGRRLDSWKEIAVFFGRDERTVKRWERQRGLPVRRVPGGQRSRVFAYAQELDQWLKGCPPEPDGRTAAPVAAEASLAALPGGLDAAPPLVPGAPLAEPVPPERAPPGPARLRPRALPALLTAAALCLAGGVGIFLAFPAEFRSVHHVPPKEARDLALAATFLWEKRTPESLREAVTGFERAIALDPLYAKAYSGLANTYNLLRQYSVMPPAEAYPLAERAARKAIELDPADADAQSALAFVEFYWLRRVDEGMRRFGTARDLDPSSPKIRHWQANALLHLGRFPEALEAIEGAQQLDPASRSILASKGLILFSAGRVAQARSLLTDLARAEPDFQAPPTYLGYLDLADGNYAGYLDHLTALAGMMHDPDRLAVATAGRRGLAGGGLPRMAEAMLAEERRLLSEGRGFAYNMARLEAIVGRPNRAVENLGLALERREQYIMSLNVDPAFRSMRGNAAYRRLVADVGLPNIE